MENTKFRFLLLQKPEPKQEHYLLVFCAFESICFCLLNMGQTIYVYAGISYFSSGKIWEKMKFASQKTQTPIKPKKYVRQ